MGVLDKTLYKLSFDILYDILWAIQMLGKQYAACPRVRFLTALAPLLYVNIKTRFF